MALHILPDLEQGSEAWHDQRRGLVTASVVGRLLTSTLRVADNDESRGLTALLVAEQISGFTDPTFINADMYRGIESEPLARNTYSVHHAPVTEVGFMRRDEDGWSLGFSPDGLVSDDGLIEIKAPRAKTHLQTILRDEVPKQYLAQCQAGLLVSGRDWLDFVSYVGGLPLYVRRVYPDPMWFEAIEKACIQFEQNAAAMVADYELRTRGLPMTERIDLNNLGLVF